MSSLFSGIAEYIYIYIYAWGDTSPNTSVQWVCYPRLSPQLGFAWQFAWGNISPNSLWQWVCFYTLIEFHCLGQEKLHITCWRVRPLNSTLCKIKYSRLRITISKMEKKWFKVQIEWTFVNSDATAGRLVSVILKFVAINYMCAKHWEEINLSDLLL